MTRETSSLTSFAGRMLTTKQLAVFEALLTHTKAVRVGDLYHSLLKKIPDNKISDTLDELATGESPLVIRTTKREQYQGNEILIEYWQLSTYAQKFIHS